MLKGEPVTKYIRNILTRSYNKTPIFVNDGIDVDFNNFHLQPSDFIRSLSFFTEKALNDTHIANAKDWEENEKPPLRLSYQTPETICFSRNSKDFLTSVRLYDLITLNSERMNESLTTNMNTFKDIEMDIFVHYPNQLIRSFGKSQYSTSFANLNSSLNGTTPKILEFKLTEFKRIKRRVDAIKPCSDKIKNYDQYLQQKFSEHLGCVPTYFKPALSDNLELKECDSPNKLQKAQIIIEKMEAETENRITEIPCDEMLVLTIDSVNSNPNPIPKDIAIKFIYSGKSYAEIQYTKAIGFESWLSNVGGFVGIFLGYSMMQAPEFLVFISSILNYERKKKFKGKL